MMKKIIFWVSLLLSNASFAQNAVAELHFEGAEKAYNAGNYKEVLAKLDEVEKLVGPMSKTLYLRIVTQDKLFAGGRNYALGDFELLSDLRNNVSTYLEVMAERGLDDRYREVYRIQEVLKSFPKTQAEWQEKLKPAPASFASVEIPPRPPSGSLNEFGNWAAQNFVMPEAAVRAKVNGTVKVSFVVERDGSLSDIEIVDDLGHGTGEELVRVLRLSGKWKPGVQNGRPVRVLYEMPMRLDTSQ